MKAGLLIIGNEVLSGSTVDQNSPFIARRLFELGVHLSEVLTLPDEVPWIARRVREFSGLYDLVITTGGVGPTHDDVTFEGVAQAFQEPLELHPALEKVAYQRFGDRTNAAALRMATIPHGAEPLWGGPFPFPPIHCRNVFIFPGVPKLLQGQFHLLEPFLSPDRMQVLAVKVVYSEYLLADAAQAAARSFPDLEVGSYPRMEPENRHVLIRFTGQDPRRLVMARDMFVKALPQGTPVEFLEPGQSG